MWDRKGFALLNSDKQREDHETVSNYCGKSKGQWFKQHPRLMLINYGSHSIQFHGQSYPKSNAVQKGRWGCQEAKVCGYCSNAAHGSHSIRILHFHCWVEFSQNISLACIHGIPCLLLLTFPSVARVASTWGLVCLMVPPGFLGKYIYKSIFKSISNQSADNVFTDYLQNTCNAQTNKYTYYLQVFTRA